METSLHQRTLSSSAITEFYHDEFVLDQARDFLDMYVDAGGTIVDVGGGCGFFALSLKQHVSSPVRVVDTDPTSVSTCLQAGVDAVQGNALDPHFVGDEAVACFNLILHHLVGDTERATKTLQRRALSAWHGKAAAIFVNEYIYESFLGNISGWIIYQITKSRILSAVGRAISHVVPAFRANTFGVGVRFRSHDEWRTFFEQAGFEIVKTRIGTPEPIALPLRVMLIKEIRRDSFWLVSRPPASAFAER